MSSNKTGTKKRAQPPTHDEETTTTGKRPAPVRFDAKDPMAYLQLNQYWNVVVNAQVQLRKNRDLLADTETSLKTASEEERKDLQEKMDVYTSNIASYEHKIRMYQQRRRDVLDHIQALSQLTDAHTDDLLANVVRGLMSSKKRKTDAGANKTPVPASDSAPFS
jgi:hypothetical protein